MIQYFPIVTGSLTVLGNINVSGSITTSGSITISGSITSASFASTASFVANAESASFASTASFVENAQTASYVLNAVSSSFASTASFVALAQSASNAVSAATASFANTLTVAGNLTAQTLVVQTITSSVIYSSGSNVFGNNIANTQVLTGSVTVTGSLTTNGSMLVTGSLRQSGSNATSSFIGLVGINTATPNYALDITGTNATGSLRIKNTGVHAQYTVDGTTGLFFRDGTNASWKSWQIATSYNDGSELSFMPSTNTSGVPIWGTTAMVIQGTGKVGIGTTSPASTLSVGVTSDTTNLGSTGLTIGGASTLTSGNVLMLNFTAIGASSARARAGIGCVVGADWGKGNLTFYTRDASNSSAMTTADERMRITQDGYVGINTTSPAGRFQVNGAGGSDINFQLNDGSSRRVFCVPSQYYGYIFAISVAADGGKGISFGNGGGASEVGSIVCNNASTTYNTTSDYRLKEDLKDFNGLNKISAIKVYDFKWKSNEERTNGVLAHELAEVLPYAVHGEKDGLGRDGNPSYQGVDYSKIVPSLVKAIQELNTKFEEYKATHP